VMNPNGAKETITPYRSLYHRVLVIAKTKASILET
jgi:hypothetical protein